MSFAVLMIALLQAVAIFLLCIMFAKNRGYAVLIGLAGCVFVTITGGDRYSGIDVVFVIVATLAAVWNLTPQKGGGAESLGNIAEAPEVGGLTPQKKGETPGEIAAFAGQAVGWGLVVLVGGWYLLSAKVKPDPVSPAPLSNQGGHVASRSYSSGGRSSSVAVVPAGSRPEKLEREKQRAAGGEGWRSGDLRRCLDLKDNAAVARCVGG